MSVFATAAQDRLLDLGDLLRELVAQGRVLLLGINNV